MQIGFVGLGKMGGNMVRKLLQEGHNVVVWNRSPEPAQEIKNQIAKSKNTRLAEALAKRSNQNLKIANTIQDLVQLLKQPRVVWLMLPAGSATQTLLDEVSKFLEPEDIIIDGGNAHFKDTEKRYKDFKEKGIKFLGIGVSGGIIAATKGYPLMVGGDKNAYDHIIPLLDSLSKPSGGYEYFGEGGAGHFVKMVHNGIEYGIMQSLSEGFDVLYHSPYSFSLEKIAKLWQKGTLVSGFMLDRAAEVLEKVSHLNNIDGVINASGEAEWTIETAKEEGVDVPIIKESLEYRKRSKTDTKIQNSYTAKMVAALRNAFGGHEIKKK